MILKEGILWRSKCCCFLPEILTLNHPHCDNQNFQIDDDHNFLILHQKSWCYNKNAWHQKFLILYQHFWQTIRFFWHCIKMPGFEAKQSPLALSDVVPVYQIGLVINQNAGCSFKFMCICKRQPQNICCVSKLIVLNQQICGDCSFCIFVIGRVDFILFASLYRNFLVVKLFTVHVSSSSGGHKTSDNHTFLKHVTVIFFWIWIRTVYITLSQPFGGNLCLMMHLSFWY